MTRNFTSRNIYYRCICTIGPEICAERITAALFIEVNPWKEPISLDSPSFHTDHHYSTSEGPHEELVNMQAGQRDKAQEWKSELTIFTIYIFVPFYF